MTTLPRLLVWRLLLWWLLVWRLLVRWLFWLDAFRIGGFLVWPCWLIVLGSVMAAWFHVFVTAGCVSSGFGMAGLAAAVYEALGLASVSLAVVRFMQRPVHCSGAAET